jgi:hypothetical protein
MGVDMRARMWLCLMGLTFAFPATASAESGSATNIHPVAGGQLEATFTASHSFCTSYGYCGWFPEASQVPATSPCDRTHLIWVGDTESNPGTQVRTDTFYPLADRPLLLCVYVYDSINGYVLVGQTVYTPPNPTNSPSPTPTPQSSTSATVPPLTIAEGRASVAGVLRDKFGGRFATRRAFKRECYRLLVSTVRCRVRWDHGQWRYSGAVDMKNDPDDPENSIVYRTSIHRTRHHTSSAGSAPSSPAPSKPEQPPSSSCDPSYKGACLKPNVSDYDCTGGSGDGPYYVQGPITVVGDDHYDLDRDGDGVACES